MFVNPLMWEIKKKLDKKKIIKEVIFKIKEHKQTLVQMNC